MFQIFKRRREANAKAKARSEQQDKMIEEGFRKMATATELVRQSARGELPAVDIVEIGDGFYVEQHQDGSRNTVVLDMRNTTAIHPPKP